MPTWQTEFTVGTLEFDMSNNMIIIREMIYPQHFHNIFTTFLQKILSFRLLLVVIVGAKK